MRDLINSRSNGRPRLYVSDYVLHIPADGADRTVMKAPAESDLSRDIWLSEER